MLQDQTRYTLPLGLAGMLSLPEYQTQYGVLMAGTLLSVLPVVLLFFALQKDFVSGLASGAVKG
jgi:ABC-type maltose transport system permease subunit